jgi:hypothetical protein
LEISPTEVVEGKPTLVTVKVTNIGKVDGTYTAMLEVNNVERAKKDMPLSAGATESLTFEVTESISGICTLGVGG